MTFVATPKEKKNTKLNIYTVSLGLNIQLRFFLFISLLNKKKSILIFEKFTEILKLKMRDLHHLSILLSDINSFEMQVRDVPLV